MPDSDIVALVFDTEDYANGRVMELSAIPLELPEDADISAKIKAFKVTRLEATQFLQRSQAFEQAIAVLITKPRFRYRERLVLVEVAP